MRWVILGRKEVFSSVAELKRENVSTPGNLLVCHMVISCPESPWLLESTASHYSLLLTVVNKVPGISLGGKSGVRIHLRSYW